MEPYRRVTHVIFDLDGTIIESESVYDEIITEIAQNYNKTYTRECRLKVLGTPEYDTAAISCRELGLPLTPEEFLAIYKPMVTEKLRYPNLMPGARELIEHLSKHKIPIAIATSSSQDAMETKTKNYQDLFKLFHHIVCGSTDKEVKQGKPAPDIFLIAAARFPDKPKPEQCLVLEDAPNGVKGAKAAGMQVVMIPDAEAPKELTKDATLVLKSLKDFKPELFGLPPFNSIKH